jgi:hypothetical protein
VLALFGEGLTSALFPCSLVLAVPGIAVAIASRRFSATALGLFVLGLLISSWLRFAGIIGVWPSLITGGAFLLSGIVHLVATAKRPAAVVALVGLLVGGATGSLWRPCVGDDFGNVLNALVESGLRGGFDLGVYIVGVMAPVIALTAAANAVPPTWIERASRPMSWFGGGILVLIGGATLSGLGDRVVNWLFELTRF